MNVILITGASEGIGAEMARQWASRGKSGTALVLAARSVDKLEAVANECRQFGCQVLVQRCDVGVQADCAALVGAAIKAFGRLDILVNNAGMSAQALFSDVTDLGWYETLMRINH
jgi:NADP-dependent 3-hydroxy acid dehydrogenase YdfG